MRENRSSGSEGGVALTPPSLPLSDADARNWAAGGTRSVWSAPPWRRFGKAASKPPHSKTLPRKGWRLQEHWSVGHRAWSMEHGAWGVGLRVGSWALEARGWG